MKFIYAFWGLFSVSAFFNKKHNRVPTAAYIIFSIFYCLRTRIGSDWHQYLAYFNNIDSARMIRGRNFELGYRALNVIFSKLGLSYWNLVTFIGVIVCILFYMSVRDLTDDLGVAFLLGLYYFFYPSYEAIRESISLVLFYRSLKYLDKDDRRFLLLNAFGILFHYTALITFVYYLLHRWPRLKLIFIPGIAAALYIYVTGGAAAGLLRGLGFLPDGILLRIEYYFFRNTRGGLRNVLSLKLGEYVLLIIILYWLFRYSGAMYRQLMDLMQFGLVLLVAFGLVSDIGYRLTYYSDAAVLLTYSNVYDRMKGLRARLLYVTALIAYTFIRFYRTV